MNIIERRFSSWLMQKKLEALMKEELLEMKNQKREKEEAFYKELEFGTSGVRGLMGVGTNRMNSPIVNRLTQGISEYLNSIGKSSSVVICYDTRKNSRKFAEDAAEVFAGNKITTYMVNEPMPLSVLSFAIREINADCGIMITASHNPKEYNGYKVYDNTGKQILTEQVAEIKKYIDKVDYFDERKLDSTDKDRKNYMKELPKEIQKKYEEKILQETEPLWGEKENINIVYSPLNGTGREVIPKLLREKGFANVITVSEQESWDGEFENCPRPNPELSEVYENAKEIARKEKADVIFTTDPDADRLGMAILSNDEYIVLNGNEIGILLLKYIIDIRKIKGNLPKKPIVVRTVVTTPLIDQLVEQINGETRYTLIGFKYIGEKQNQMEKKGEDKDFILGAEEANGYLATNFVRDKDGISSLIISAMMVSHYKANGKNMIEVLEEIYRENDYYKEKTLDFKLEGVSGEKTRKLLMDNLRKTYLKLYFGQESYTFTDYKTKNTKILNSKKTSNYPKSKKIITLPQSNMLEFLLEEGKVVIRPSGTEPKLKVYLFARGKTEEEATRILDRIEEKTRQELEEQISKAATIIREREEKARKEEFWIEEDKRKEELRKEKKRQWNLEQKGIEIGHVEKTYPKAPTKTVKIEKGEK